MFYRKKKKKKKVNNNKKPISVPFLHTLYIFVWIEHGCLFNIILINTNGQKRNKFIDTDRNEHSFEAATIKS